ncbi:hypothetical protein QEZ54_08850 [Catellatospora sp. KI3]|uniref:hypothetical protein n=1 Tax=Catellatospora sp. KI3 TaxID=3041620 RepID=UPI002482B373|nr:hypothetical protein [Catellatospora sp. KI3]MDI1461070.1 hypothetical protein [Catellatospora sp. KI3]
MTTHVTPMTSPSAAPARPKTPFARLLLGPIFKIMRWRTGTPTQYDPPAQPPLDRDPATVDSIDQYTTGAPVWAYIGGSWLCADVAGITSSSTLVIYPAPGSADVMVETVHTSHLQLRDRPVREGDRSASPAASEDLPTADQARVTLSLHHRDELGLCTACAERTQFRWAPCPDAKQAMAVLGIDPATQIGAP